MQPPQIAVNRFGLGARPDEPLPVDARGWLRAQIGRFDPSPPELAGLPGTVEVIRRFTALKPEPKPDDKSPSAAVLRLRHDQHQLRRGLLNAELAGRMHAAVHGNAPFAERLVAFWSNHFAISTDKLSSHFAGPFEREAIRPHVMGRFSDMLNAVERHPAMLQYLDQTESIGPNSALAASGKPPAKPGSKLGLNENFGREIMELHTLGARSGYTQADVTEFSRALTGWTVAGIGRFGKRLADATPGEFAFIEALHEPGTRTIMGERYPQPGEAQAQAVLDALAAHPATATHIATKLARHFAGDDPPPSLIDKLARAYSSSGGDLPSVYHALIDAPEPWAPAPVKFRQPWEWLIAALRATGVTLSGDQLDFALIQLGQQTWRPGSPAGWDDIAASWAAPDALLRRVDFAASLAISGGTFGARALVDSPFGVSLGDPARAAVADAESPAQALALLLVAPEMQRR